MSSTIKSLSVLFILFSQVVLADSPLTSIEFYRAYLGNPMIEKAAVSKGKITSEILGFLTDEENQQAEKLAVINALGWNHNNTNSKVYRNHIIKTKNYKSEFGGKYTAFLWNASASELLYYSYMKAMENYSQPLFVFEYLDKAIKKEPKNLNIRLVYELIKAQVLYEINEKDLANENIKAILIKLDNNESNVNIEALTYFQEYFNLTKS